MTSFSPSPFLPSSPSAMSRRAFIGGMGSGLGGIALTALMQRGPRTASVWAIGSNFIRRN